MSVNTLLRHKRKGDQFDWGQKIRDSSLWIYCFTYAGPIA